ncbi:MAG: cache domain-containing protein [Gammaproteobacteria bacterium]
MLRFWSAVTRSVRYKLLALVLVPILLVVPAVFALSVYWSDKFARQTLFMKVTTDLAVAHDIFKRIRQDYLAKLTELGESYRLRSLFEKGDFTGIEHEIAGLKEREGFAFLHFMQPEAGGVWGSVVPGRKNTPLYSRALLGKAGVGVEIFSNRELGLEDPSLAERIKLPLLETPRAVPTTRTVEDRAMVLRVLYPIRSAFGEVLAILDGGVLLNNNFEFVDTIRDLVYGPGSLHEESVGTVTVFLDDVRITTNVPLRKGERALGTRVSREVREKVLEQGESWIESAFVVNDWYISAYEPIVDVEGRRVGMLYAGFLEAPYRRENLEALGVLILLFLGVTLVSTIVAVRGATSIFRPLESMTEVVRATQRGEERRNGEVRSQDELGELARQFDQMLDLLQERARQIQQYNDELENKVEERTAQLQRKNVELQKTIDLLKDTRQQLVSKEKLAALGELTAGIAYELNNPTAVILGNLDLIRAELGRTLDPVRTELELIDQQCHRIRSIVDNLLQYSRPSQYIGAVKEVDVNSVIDDTLMLVSHAVDKKEIVVTKRCKATRKVQNNAQHLQHVLVNLITNAVNAMEPGGEIVLGTCDWKNEGVVVYVKDEGRGIERENLDRIFDPFFTTSKKGTGLGLPVSYALTRRYGGRITVKSRPGRGSIFYVWLLTQAEMQDEDDLLLANIA